MKNFREDVDTLVTNFKKLCKPREEVGIWYYVKDGRRIDVETRMNEYGHKFEVEFEEIWPSVNTMVWLEEYLDLSKLSPNYLEYDNNVKILRYAYLRLLKVYSDILKDLGEHP